MSTLLQRTLSGAVYVAVMVGSVLAPGTIWFTMVATVMTVMAIREFMLLTGKDTWLWIMASLSAMAMQGILLTMVSENLYSSDYDTFDILIAIAFCTMVVVPLMVVIAELFRQAENPMKNWGRYWQAVTMIGFPFACMTGLLAMNPHYLLALFISVWINDTGAYLVGMATARLPKGNHKMFPRVSPKKSWEGLVGGIVFNLLAGYVFYRVGWFTTPWIALAFAALVSVFGTLGDLLESLMKRTVGVKDSGRFMPGHGGVLDRFDSLLLAAPVVVLFLFMIR